MSGEAGGIIVGGVLLVGALPYILAGAAVIGGAAGLAALGSSALRSRENRRESSLKVDRCSKELSDLYDRLRTAMDSQSARGAQRCEELEAQMRGFSDRLRQAAAESRDPEQLDRLLRQAREERGRTLGTAREEALARIQREGREEVSAALAAGVRLRGLSGYYTARPERCPANTVVLGYASLADGEIPALAEALRTAWT